MPPVAQPAIDTSRASRLVATPPLPPRPRLAASKPGTGHHPQRHDIQGLRALAVLLVVAYHLQPDRLPGGFVGVDVFFVISGYLIVGSLSREAIKTQTIRLGQFYARRVRRLLPAATVVLLAVVVATVLLMPVSRWRATALDVITSALQVQNWALAFGAGSYAEATAAVSSVQHFWSLAVEEQFYLFVPVLLLGTVAAATRLRRDPQVAIVWVLSGVALLSFVHSITYSASNHDVAYFATTTRIWELAIGGLAAVGVLRAPGRQSVRWAAGWAGVLAIGASALLLNTTMAFPGWLAAIPVLGTLAVVWMPHSPVDSTRPGDFWHRVSVTALLGLRPARFIGDVSYSMYLWHWPVIVFFIHLSGHEPTAVEGVALVAVLIAFSWASTQFIEAPFRSARPRPGRRERSSGSRSAALLAGGLVATSVVVAAVPLAYVSIRAASASTAGLDADHPGGRDELPEDLPAFSEGVEVVPDPIVAADDRSITMSGVCDSYEPGVTDPAACTFGDVDSDQVVVLVGDSHASQFSTVLADAGSDYGWRVQAMVRAGCPFNASPLVVDGARPTGCVDADARILDEVLDLNPDVVVTSAMTPRGYADALGWTWDDTGELVEGYRSLWQPIVDAGIRLVVIRDVPFPTYDGPDCVAEHGPESTECSMTRAEALPEGSDPLLLAAEGMDGVSVVDLSDHLCNDRVCPGVVGNVLVYRDNHLTDTFARSLGPVLSTEIGLI